MSDDQVLEAIEVAKSTGKLKKGSNEATKAIEKGTAKLVAIAKDTEPKEIVMHIPLLCKEKGIPCFEIATKEELGGAAGIEVGTTAIAIIQEGEAKALIEKLKPTDEKAEVPKEEVKEEPKEEKKEEAPKEEKKEKLKEEKKEEAPAEEKKEEEKAEEAPKKEEKKE